jgi:hypothetical protein
MAFIRPSRLTSIALAALAVGLTLAGLDAALRAAFGRDPRWVPPQFIWEYLDTFGGRLARVQQMVHSGQLRDDQWVAAIGLSTVRDDLDPPTLAAVDPLHRRWLTLGGAGDTFVEVNRYSQVFRESPLRPGLIVLGAHEFWLHHEDPPPAASVPFWRALVHRHFNEAFESRSWLYRNHDGLVETEVISVCLAQSDVRRAFGLAMSATYAPLADPWYVPLHDNVKAPHASAVYLDNQLRGLQRTLNPARFADNNDEIECFQRLVAALRALGDRGLRADAGKLGVASDLSAGRPNGV